MRAEQLTRLETLRDRLLEVALSDADPANWIGADKKPKEMTRDERGDAKWCRSLAVQTVSLTMQVQRLMQNPIAGGAAVPDEPAKPEQDEGETVEAEIERYERAASEVLARAARGGRGKR
jgi:hypothetical protein